MKIISSEKNKELALLVAQEEILRMEKEKREDKVVALVSSVLKTLDIKDDGLLTLIKRQGKTFIVSFDEDTMIVMIMTLGESLKMLMFFFGFFRSRMMFPIVEQNVDLE